MIYLVRHGQTEFNREGRFQGALDSALTPLGVSQARAYGRLLAELCPDAARIVSSPQGRARRTAELIAAAGGLDLPVALDDRLREITVGAWDGRLRADVDREFPGARDGDRRYDWYFSAPGAESYKSMADRLASWLEDAAKLDGVTIAVSHGVAGRILRGLYSGLSKAELLSLDVPQDAVFRFVDGVVQRFDCEPATSA
jgi:broad specificity phosphatase PhoE